MSCRRFGTAFSQRRTSQNAPEEPKEWNALRAGGRKDEAAKGSNVGWKVGKSLRGYGEG